MPIVISPAQALLLLIDKHSKNPLFLERLKKWYISGIELKDHKEFEHLIRDPIFSNYQVSTDPRVINNDPTRRYFETHVAYHTLKTQIDDVPTAELQRHASQLKESLPMDDLSSNKKLSAALLALEGVTPRYDDDTIKEYATYIRRIIEGDLFNKDDATEELRQKYFTEEQIKSFFDKGAEFTPEQREKIKLIVQIAFLGVINAWNREDLPLDLYNDGIFANENRGKVFKADPQGEKTNTQNTTRNAALGLFHGETPLPRDDIAYTSRADAPSFLKPSDQSSFDEEARWVKENFKLLVHPFSNSISGTMLCQLRNLADLKSRGMDAFINSRDDFNKFSRLLTATMLYGSGGHSLYEFLALFDLEQVKKEFPEALTSGSPITVLSMFYTENRRAFNTALGEVIRYNHELLKRKEVLLEIDPNTEIHKFNRDKERVFTESLDAGIKKLLSAFGKHNMLMNFFTEVETELKGKKAEILGTIHIEDYNNLRALISKPIEAMVNEAIRVKIMEINEQHAPFFDNYAEKKFAEFCQNSCKLLKPGVFFEQVKSDLQQQRKELMHSPEALSEDEFRVQASERIITTLATAHQIKGIIESLEELQASIKKDTSYLYCVIKPITLESLDKIKIKLNRVDEIKLLLTDQNIAPDKRLAAAKEKFDQSGEILMTPRTNQINLLAEKFQSALPTYLFDEGGYTLN